MNLCSKIRLNCATRKFKSVEKSSSKKIAFGIVKNRKNRHKKNENSFFWKEFVQFKKKNHQFEKNCTKKSFKKIPKITRPKTNFLTSSEKKETSPTHQSLCFYSVFSVLWWRKRQQRRMKKKKWNNNSQLLAQRYLKIYYHAVVFFLYY